jgi:hypothetical protein
MRLGALPNGRANAPETSNNFYSTTPLLTRAAGQRPPLNNPNPFSALLTRDDNLIVD